MARARNIKPGFYKNEDLAECTVWARFIYPGLWMLADREGRLEDRPKRIRAEILPFDLVDVDPLLDELVARGFIRRYAFDGRRYIQITKFLHHQNPHGTEKDSEIPDDDGFYTRHERSKNNCITGTCRKVGGVTQDNNGEITVKEPLVHALNPSSLNPESLNHSGERQQGAITPGRQAAQPKKPKTKPKNSAKSAQDPPPAPDPVPEPGTETPPSGEKPPKPAPDADAITVRAVEIAVLLRQRGAGVAAGEIRLRDWAGRGITDAVLLTALETATQRRTAAGSVQPVNSGLLDSILADAPNPMGTSPPARASPHGGGKQAARDAYLADADEAAQRHNLDEGGKHGRTTERDITGQSARVA